MKELINYINTFTYLNNEAIQQLENLAENEYFKKNEHILKEGQYCNKIWFIEKGMVRKHSLCDGKEITSWIYTEKNTFTSLQSYSQQITTKEYLQACEDTHLVSITRENSKLLAQLPEFAAFTNALMEIEFVNNDMLSKIMKEKNAKERYEYLKQIAPELIRRAKLGHIASIIGITQETLSRIRKL